jgi:hypothetical protein
MLANFAFAVGLYIRLIKAEPENKSVDFFGYNAKN